MRITSFLIKRAAITYLSSRKLRACLGSVLLLSGCSASPFYLDEQQEHGHASLIEALKDHRSALMEQTKDSAGVLVVVDSPHNYKINIVGAGESAEDVAAQAKTEDARCDSTETAVFVFNSKQPLSPEFFDCAALFKSANAIAQIKSDVAQTQQLLLEDTRLNLYQNALIENSDENIRKAKIDFQKSAEQVDAAAASVRDSNSSLMKFLKDIQDQLGAIQNALTKF